MHRVDTKGHIENRFFDGDSTGPEIKEATILSAKWLNSVQEELCTLIESQGLKLEEKQNSQIKKAIEILIISSLSKSINPLIKTINQMIDHFDDDSTVPFPSNKLKELGV